MKALSYDCALKPVIRLVRLFLPGLNSRAFHPHAPPASRATIYVLAVAAAVACISGARAEVDTSVTTYHNDPQRTGWNPKEVRLTSANVTPASFGLIAKVALDDTVDAQPLVVAAQTIEGQGIHTVVYVATEGNTVYAIDSASGKILKTRNLGTAVPNPFKCPNNPPRIGITSTPTIDARTRTIYVMAYVLVVASRPTSYMHSISAHCWTGRAHPSLSRQRIRI